jgi:hypothetical protein
MDLLNVNAAFRRPIPPTLNSHHPLVDIMVARKPFPRLVDLTPCMERLDTLPLFTRKLLNREQKTSRSSEIYSSGQKYSKRRASLHLPGQAECQVLDIVKVVRVQKMRDHTYEDYRHKNWRGITI